MFFLGVDLGQSVDYTAISIVQRLPGVSPTGKPEAHYQLRYLRRPDLGTKYTEIVPEVVALVHRAPLSPTKTPVIVDKTGVGTPVVDMFSAAGLRPRAVTISAGTQVTRTHPYDISVPKRDLASLLVALYQGHRLKVAADLPLADTLTRELINFKMKINLQTGHDSYEAWREGVHDDLVLSVALACWWAENMGGRPFRSARAVPHGTSAAALASSVVAAYAREQWRQDQRARRG